MTLPKEMTAYKITSNLITFFLPNSKFLAEKNCSLQKSRLPKSGAHGLKGTKLTVAK